MTDRKNLKVPEDVYDDLTDEKGQYETWAQFFQRVLASNLEPAAGD